MPKYYFDTIEQGDPVAPLTKPPVTRVQIARFSGASQDYSPLHIDDDFAKSAGYGGVFAHGSIGLGFANEAVTRWLENGRVLTANAKYHKLVWPGDILTAKGVVVDTEEVHGECRIIIDVWTENQNHDVVMKGQLICLVWSNEKEEKKNKGKWPPVSPKTVAQRKTAQPIEKPKSGKRTPLSKATAEVRPPKKSLARGTPAAEEKKKSAKKAAAKKAPAKKPAAKKAPPKKAPAKKAAAKKAPAKKPAAKKAPVKKAAKKKAVAKKAPAKKKAAAKKAPKKKAKGKKK